MTACDNSQMHLITNIFIDFQLFKKQINRLATDLKKKLHYRQYLTLLVCYNFENSRVDF